MFKNPHTLHNPNQRRNTMKETVNLHIVDGEPFYAHEATINFTPTQFIMDYKCITPRTDQRSKNTVSFLLKHNVIMLDPWHAKQLNTVLANILKRYEDEFGTIKKPKPLEKAEKKHKTLQAAQQSGEKTDAPTYFG